MTHSEAEREMLMERYLLGELSGDSRDAFEEHIFECAICAADLRVGAALAESLRAGGPQLVNAPVAAPVMSPRPTRLTGPPKAPHARWGAAIVSPWVLGPALAACLLLLLVQLFVVQPRLGHELAAAQTPEVLKSLALAGGMARGPGTATATATRGGNFLLSVDIPAESRFGSYRCTLIAPDGKAFWHVDLTPDQVNDAVWIKVPVQRTKAGANVVIVEGVAAGAAPVPLLRQAFDVKIVP